MVVYKKGLLKFIVNIINKTIFIYDTIKLFLFKKIALFNEIN